MRVPKSGKSLHCPSKWLFYGYVIVAALMGVDFCADGDDNDSDDNNGHVATPSTISHP